MAGSFELVWSSDGVERAFPIHGVVTIGRGPSNDLVLPGAEVSYQHARLWIDEGVLWVVDTGSTNGTFVGSTRIDSKTSVESGGTVRMGTHTLTAKPIEGEDNTTLRWVVEDLDSGLRRPLGQKFVIGTSTLTHFRVEGVEATITRSEHGYWLETEDERRLLSENTEEVVGPLRLMILQVGPRVPRLTVRPAFADDCYHVDASLDARTPWAKIHDDAGRTLEIEGEARATLVFVLARTCLDHREQGIAPEEEGWIDDQEVAAAVWGRTGRSGVGNKLSVVVYRLRADLKKVGMKGTFVERKRGRIRVRCGRISLTD